MVSIRSLLQFNMVKFAMVMLLYGVFFEETSLDFLGCPVQGTCDILSERID